jgi:hypothetical protein
MSTNVTRKEQIDCIKDNNNDDNKDDKLKLIPKNKYRKEFLIQYKPELFNTTSKGSKRYKKNVKEENEFLKCSFEQIKEFNRKKVIQIGEKYYDIHSNIDKYKKILIESKIEPNDSPCNPDNFSDTVVKPNMRDYIKYHDTTKDLKLEKKKYLEKIIKKLEIHFDERTYQQAKADLSEYYLYINNDNIIPTLNHKKGIDMYYLNNNQVESLDIKTTRNIWDKDGEEAIKSLYENQGNDRFSSNPLVM